MTDRQLYAIIGLILLAAGGFTWWVISNSVACDETCTYVSRRFDPAHTETYYTQQCFSYDKDGSCTMSVPIAHTNRYPDRWYITWRDAYGRPDMEERVDHDVYISPPSHVHHRHTRWRKCPPQGQDVRGWGR